MPDALIPRRAVVDAIEREFASANTEPDDEHTRGRRYARSRRERYVDALRRRLEVAVMPHVKRLGTGLCDGSDGMPVKAPDSRRQMVPNPSLFQEQA